MEKTLLSQLLSDKPMDTKNKATEAFANVDCNFEFAVSVNMSEMQGHMDNANMKGFIVWCNQDANSAIIYGAGSVYQESFTECMNWINSIRVGTDVALTHFMTNEGEKFLEIK